MTPKLKPTAADSPNVRALITTPHFTVAPADKPPEFVWPEHIISLAQSVNHGDYSALVPLHDALIEFGVSDHVVASHFRPGDGEHQMQGCVILLSILCGWPVPIAGDQ